MNNLEYTVFVDAMATGTFGNLLLLPSATTDNSGGQLTVPSAEPDSSFKISGELTVGTNFPAGENNIFIAHGMDSYNSSLTAGIAFTNGGTLNFSAQNGDVRLKKTVSDYEDSKIRIVTSSTKYVGQTYDDSYVASGKYESTTFSSPTSTLTIISDLAGTIRNRGGVSLIGYYSDQKKENKADNSSGNTLSSAVFRANALTLKNNFSATLEAQQTATIESWKDAKANDNNISASGIWVEGGNFRVEGNFGKRTSNSSSDGKISAKVTALTIVADGNVVQPVTVYKLTMSRTVYEELLESSLYGTELQSGTASPKEDDNNVIEIEYDDEKYKKLKWLKGNDPRWTWTTDVDVSSDASAANNTFGAYGIRAENGNIEINRDFGADVSAELSNIKISVTAIGKDKTPTLSATLNSFGMKAKNFSLNGTFDGNVSATITDVTMRGSGGTKAGASNSITITAAAIYMENTVSVGTYFSGDLNFTRKKFKFTVSPSEPISVDAHLYGIHAGSSLNVGNGHGLIDTNITVSTVSSERCTYVTGVYAPTIKAESFGATVNVSSDGRDLVVGIQTDNFVNGTDSIFNLLPSTFDIIGDITVTASNPSGCSIGVLVAERGNINLRVSSNITAVSSDIRAAYAFYAGTWSWDNTTQRWTGTRNGSGNDKLEIAAGATINGIIDLGDGTDTIYIDSNARVNGNIRNIGGRKNITFQLNQYGAVKDGTIRNSSSSDLIYMGDFSAETTTLVVDINDAESGRTYYLLQNAAIEAGTKAVTVVYNAETRIISFRNGEICQPDAFSDGTTVKGTIENGVLTITAIKAELAPEVRIANAVKLEQKGDVIAWDCSGTNYSESTCLTITYDLYDSNGNFKETVKLDPAELSKRQVAVEGKEAGDIVKNIRASIENSAGERINTLSVVGGIDADRNVFRMEWSLALKEAISSNYRFELEYCVKKAGQSEFSNSTVVTLDYLSSFYELANITKNDEVMARIRVKRIGSTEDVMVGEWSKTILAGNTSLIEEAPAKIMNLVSNRLGDLSSALSVLEWTDMRNAFESGLQYYEIQFFDAGLDRNLTDDELRAIFDGPSQSNYTVLTRQTTSNQFYLTNSDFNKNYYWRVRAISNNNTEGEWSSVCRYLAVGEDKTPPVKSTICDSITITTSFDYVANTISWSWNKEMAVDESVSGVTEYVIYYKAEGDSEYQRYQLAANKESIYSATLTVLSALNQKYTYYITARDAAGNESGKLKFKTLQGDVTAPVNGALTLLDKKYEKNTAGGIDLVVTFSINQATDIAGSDEVAGGPSGVKLYTLQYRKLAADGNEVWVTVKTFDDSVFSDGKFEYTTAGIDTRDIPANSNGECPTYWRLCVEDKAGNTATTDITTIIAMQPGTITFTPANMYKPVVSGDNQNFTVTLSWKEALGDPYLIAGYDVYISVDGTYWTRVRSVSATDNLSVTISNLDGLAGKSGYYWAVEAVDSKGFKSGLQFDLDQNSNSFFWTPFPDPAFMNESITVSYVDSNTLWVSITWTDGGTAGTYILQSAASGSDDWTDVLEQDTVGFGYTIPASQKNIQYRLVKRNADGSLTYSSATYTPTGDLHGPSFTTSEIVSSRVDGTYYFSWSAAVDGQISAEEAVSGLRDYVLYFSTSSDMSNAIAITIDGTFTSMNNEDMRNMGFGDGTYYWAVAARDNAGNESGKLMGAETITIKVTTPQGDFNTATTKSTLTIDWEMVDDPRGPNYAQVRQPANLDLTLSIGGDFTDVSGVYYQVTFYSDANCTDDVFSTEKFARTGSVTTYSLNSSNNLIAYLAEYAESLIHNDWRVGDKLPPYVYWKVTVSDAYGNSRTLDKINKFRFVDETIAEGRPTNDYYAPNAPKLKAVRAVTEDDLSREEFNGLTDAQKAAYKQYIKDYPGSLYLIEWDPVYDAYGIKSYKIYTSNGKETTVYDTYKDGDMLTYVSAGKVLAGLYGTAPSGKWTFWVSAVDGSGLESKTSDKLTYTYFPEVTSLTGLFSDNLYGVIQYENEIVTLHNQNETKMLGILPMSQWTMLCAGDFYGDGRDGILWMENATGNIYVHNDLTTVDEVVGKKNLLGTVADGYEVRAAGDFFGTGFDGALLLSPAFGDSTVSLNYGLATWSREQDGSTTPGWLGALVNTWEESGALNVLKGDFQNLTGDERNKVINANNYRYELVGVGDFNGDGIDDVMLRNTMPDTVGGETITGAGDVFVFLTDTRENVIAGNRPAEGIVYTGCATDGWDVVGIGDFNGDGIDDVVISNGTDLAGWQVSNGQRTENLWFGSLTDGWKFAGVGDFDADGTDDILLADPDNNLTAWKVKDGQVAGIITLA